MSDPSLRTPSRPLPEVNSPDLQAFLEPTDSLRFIWLGHSTVLVNAQNKLILVDPVFSNSGAPVNFFGTTLSASCHKFGRVTFDRLNRDLT